LITVAGIIAVVAAGAFAVSANLGILHASADRQIGSLTAGDLITPGAASPAPASEAPAPIPTGTTLVALDGTTATRPDSAEFDDAGEHEQEHEHDPYEQHEGRDDDD
jgi:hypothetical protein